MEPRTSGALRKKHPSLGEPSTVGIREGAREAFLGKSAIREGVLRDCRHSKETLVSIAKRTWQAPQKISYSAVVVIGSFRVQDEADGNCHCAKAPPFQPKPSKSGE